MKVAVEAIEGCKRRLAVEAPVDVVRQGFEHAPAPVTADDLSTALDHMREQQAQFHAVERPAASGDLVVVDYTLTIDGHDPSSQTSYEFLVGARNVLPEIDDAVVGLRAGEERQVTLRFADDQRREDLRGRGGDATGNGGEVKGEGLPSLDARPLAATG